jgi:hypothetical protein
MSKKKTTTTSQSQTAQFAPGALNGYTTALNQAQGMVKNPYGNPFYQQTLTQGMNAANSMNQNAQQNVTSNIARSGIGASSPAAMMMMQQAGYMGSHTQAGAFMNASQQAQGMYGAGMNFLGHPLQTGQSMNGTSTEKTSGVGSWLPQVAGAALGAAAGVMTGGATTMAGRIAGGLKGAAGALGGGGGNAAGGDMGSMSMGMVPSNMGMGSSFGFTPQNSPFNVAGNAAYNPFG